jgi:CDP-glucose 4,6-dehydratase
MRPGIIAMMGLWPAKDVECSMIPWADRTVLVTGAAGFLGGQLVRALSQRSARLVALVNDSVPQTLTDLTGLEIVRANLCDPAALQPVFRRRIDMVFHLAAQTLPTLAREDPRPTFEANTQATWNLLEAARSAPLVPHIVIASTDSVYGENADGAPFTEEARLAPSFPYETSKACAEMVARCYHETYALPIAIARFCNLYGPGDVAGSRLMAGTIAAAVVGKRQQLRGDGSAVRNYLYVEDAVAALLSLAEALDQPGIAGQAFNFCDEEPVSVLDIVNRVLRFVDRPDLAPHIGAGTPGEISIKRASAQRAHQALGWEPTISLDEGLARTIAWHRDQLRLAQETDS